MNFFIGQTLKQKRFKKYLCTIYIVYTHDWSASNNLATRVSVLFINVLYILNKVEVDELEARFWTNKNL